MAVTLIAYRGRLDNGNETTAGWAAAQNTPWTQQVDVNFRIRFLHQNAASLINNLDIQLQYNLNGAGWVDVTATSNVVRSSASANLADAANLTSQLTGGTGTFIGATGFDEVNGICGGNSMDVTATGNFETEFCVQLRGADVAFGDTIELRTINSDSGADWGAYTVVASMTAAKSLSKTPSVGGMLAAGLAVVLAMSAHVSITPNVGSLSATGNAPIVVGQNVRPGTGEAFFGLETLASQSRTPAAGALSLEGQTPVIGTVTAITPQTGSVAITGSTPTIARQIFITPLVGIVSTGPIAPTLLQNYIRGPPVTALTLAGAQPTIEISSAGNTNRTPVVGALTFIGNAPSVQTSSSTSITPSAGALVFTPVAPLVGTVRSITPSAGTLSAIGVAPTVQVSSGGSQSITPSVGEAFFGIELQREITPLAGRLLIGLFPGESSPTVTPATGIALISGNTPEVGARITPNAGSIAFGGLAPTLGQVAQITPAAGSLTTAGIAPTALKNNLLTPTSGALTAIGLQPNLQISSPADFVRTPSTAAVNIIGAAPTARATIAPATGSLSFSGSAPVLALKITPLTQNLSILGVAPSLLTDTRIEPIFGEVEVGGLLAVEGDNPTIDLGVVPSVGGLELSGTTSTILHGTAPTAQAGTLAITGIAPEFISGTGIAPDTGSLSTGDVAPVLSFGSFITPQAGALSLASDPPSVQISSAGNTNRTPSGGVLTFSGTQPNIQISSAGNTNVTPSAGAVSIVGLSPSTASSPPTSISPNSGSMRLSVRSDGATPRIDRFWTSRVICRPITGALPLIDSDPVAGAMVTIAVGAAPIMFAVAVVGVLRKSAGLPICRSGWKPEAVSAPLVGVIRLFFNAVGAMPEVVKDPAAGVIRAT